MKHLILVILISLSGLPGYAGNGFGGGPGDKLNAYTGNSNSDLLSDIAKDSNGSNIGQVYFMRKKQAEIQFATNAPGDSKVELHSLRPEEISNSALIEGLKRSQQSQQWENIRLPSKLEMNRMILNNKLGGMQRVR